MNIAEQDVVFGCRVATCQMQMDGGQVDSIVQVAGIDRVDHIEGHLVEEEALSQRILHLALHPLVHHGIALEEDGRYF